MRKTKMDCVDTRTVADPTEVSERDVLKAQSAANISGAISTAARKCFL
jgi:hypothetical protein